MRVALIHHQYKLKGGMETYLFNLISGFTQANDEVSAHVYKQSPDAAVTCEINKTNLFWLPRSWRKYWFGNFLHKYKEMQNYDMRITLMRSFHQDIIICGGTHRGFLSHTQKKPSLQDKLEIACEQKSYDTSSLIIAHSGLLKEELINLYNIPSDKIVMAFPPIRIEKFSRAGEKERKALKQKFNIDPTKKAILFPSTGHRRKGFYLIMEALKYLPKDQFELIVSGNKPEDSLSHSLKYVGFVEDMALLYNACDVTLLPSYYEPFGLVIPESLQCGTPVIISKFVGAKDLVSEKEGIILADLSPETIAKAIMKSTTHSFSIVPKFAERNNLTISSHIETIKANFAVKVNR